MKLIDSRPYLTIEDGISCGLAKDANYINKEKSRGAKWAVFIKDPLDNRKTLIEYDSLSDTKKSLVLQKFGNPYEYLAKEPIRNMVTLDLEAHNFYIQYRYDGKSLPDTHVEAYTKAASWLNMLVAAESNKKQIKQQLNLSMKDFWLKVCEMIDAEKIDLPRNIIRLREKIDLYKENKYAALIHKQFGNDRAKKVTGEEAESVLLNMISDANNHDDVFICYSYNIWAAKNNLKQISPATVGNFRRKNLKDVLMERSGNNAFNEKFVRQINGMRPSAPLYLCEHDDNNLDFLFHNENDDKISKYVAIVVIDSHNGHTLGYSYMQGKRPSILQVYEAYHNAMYYIRSLTGGWHLPFEIKSDKYASATLNPFYERIAKFVPPAHGNKHRGYIEQFFSSPLWKRSQRLVSSGNFSGNNMTAKFRGVNQEALSDNQRYRRLPMIGDQADRQIENFFHLLRHMPDIKREEMNAPSREQKWVESWNKLTPEQKRPITDEQFLLIFGIRHNPDRPISITNTGVCPQINNVQYKFDLPEAWMYDEYPGEKVTVIYDPYDMSRVLITNGSDIRFIAKTSQLIPRACKDHYPGSRAYLNAILAEKKQQVKRVASTTDRRKQYASIDTYQDHEAVLQAGVLDKLVKNSAEIGIIDDDYEKFLDDNNDFEQFFK